MKGCITTYFKSRMPFGIKFTHLLWCLQQKEQGNHTLQKQGMYNCYTAFGKATKELSLFFIRNKLICDLALPSLCWVSWNTALIGTWLPAVLKSLLGKPRMISQHSSNQFSTVILQAAQASWADTLLVPYYAKVLLHEQNPLQPMWPQERKYQESLEILFWLPEMKYKSQYNF